MGIPMPVLKSSCREEPSGPLGLTSPSVVLITIDRKYAVTTNALRRDLEYLSSASIQFEPKLDFD